MFSFTVQSPKIDRTTFKIYNLMKKKILFGRSSQKKNGRKKHKLSNLYFSGLNTNLAALCSIWFTVVYKIFATQKGGFTLSIIRSTRNKSPFLKVHLPLSIFVEDLFRCICNGLQKFHFFCRIKLLKIRFIFGISIKKFAISNRATKSQRNRSSFWCKWSQSLYFSTSSFFHKIEVSFPCSLPFRLIPFRWFSQYCNYKIFIWKATDLWNQWTLAVQTSGHFTLGLRTSYFHVITSHYLCTNL